MNTKPIPIFAINLKSRVERRTFISSQFIDREEFDFFLIEALEHSIGTVGLWNTLRYILQDLVRPEDEYIILCEDDHQFTPSYSKDRLISCIEEAKKNNADMLSGGVSGFTAAIKVSDDLYWVEKFSGLQFTVLFRKFFQTILVDSFDKGDAVDYKLCALTENKFFTYPFLSIQKEFGYSDVTVGNNAKGHIEKVFKDSKEKVEVLKTISTFYKQKLIRTEPLKSSVRIESIVIPTYIIHLYEKTEHLRNIEKQFTGKEEFNIAIIEACHHKVKELGVWLSIKKIIETAIENDDDVIIICREDHQFTKHYERTHFMKLIWHAGLLGCNVLTGGMGAFNLALPIIDGLFWIDSFWSSKFFVIYRPFYESILLSTFSDTDNVESKFSEMTSNKMVLFPYISIEKNYDYSDVTDLHKKVKGRVTNLFVESSRRLGVIQNAYLKYPLYNEKT